MYKRSDTISTLFYFITADFVDWGGKSEETWGDVVFRFLQYTNLIEFSVEGICACVYLIFANIMHVFYLGF